jgi:hypothetical protein
VCTVAPATVVAGMPIAPALQIVARDRLGNTATSFTGDITVTFGTNPNGGTLVGTTTRPAVAGIATFADLSIDKAASGYTLTATAPALGLSCVTSAFSVAPGEVTQLVFTVAPTTTTAGAAFTPAVQVTARDAHDNTATEFTGSVTLAIGTNPGGGTLAGPVTRPAVAGIATFPNLSIDKGDRLHAAGQRVARHKRRLRGDAGRSHAARLHRRAHDHHGRRPAHPDPRGDGA